MFLCLLTLCDVEHGTVHSHRLTNLVVCKPASTSDPMNIAVWPDDAILMGIFRMFLAGVLDYPVEFLQIFGMNPFLKTGVCVIKFAWSKPEQVLMMPKPDHLPGDKIPVPQTDVSRVNCSLQTVLIGSQCFFTPLMVDDFRLQGLVHLREIRLAEVLPGILCLLLRSTKLCT